jgi:hypothetical protein
LAEITIKPKFQVILTGNGYNDRNHPGVLDSLIPPEILIFVGRPPYNLTGIELPGIFQMSVELDEQVIDKHILDLIAPEEFDSDFSICLTELANPLYFLSIRSALRSLMSSSLRRFLSIESSFFFQWQRFR